MQSPTKKRKTGSGAITGEIDFSRVAAIAAKPTAERLEQLPDADFRVTILQNQLSQMIYTLDGTLTEAQLVICKTPTFKGIRCDATSPDLTCMIKGKVAAEVAMNGEKEPITILLRDFNPIMKATQGANAVDIVRYTGEDFLTIECLGSNPFKRWRVRTLVTEENNVPILNINSKFTIDIQCNQLKDFARRSSDYNCETVLMRILRLDGKDAKHHFFEMSNNGDGLKKAEVAYHSISRSLENNSIEIVCDAAVTPEQMIRLYNTSTQLYAAEFQSSYISDFLKVFDRGSIHLNLAQEEEGEPGPLILHAGLGNDASFMRLLLAPKMTEDHDEDA